MAIRRDSERDLPPSSNPAEPADRAHEVDEAPVKRRRPDRYEAAGSVPTPDRPALSETRRATGAADSERIIELREEQLVAHKELRDLGDVEIRKVVEEQPGRLEVDAFSEEVQVEHVPVGRAVTERTEPWEDGDVLVVPVYEEQLVVTKRLVLREELHIRRVRTTERQLYEDTLRRERLEVDDPNQTGLVHERYADDTGQADNEPHAARRIPPPADQEPDEGGLMGMVKRALQ